MVAFTIDRFLTALTGQLLYAALLILAIAGIYGVAVRRLHVQGG